MEALVISSASFLAGLRNRLNLLIACHAHHLQLAADPEHVREPQRPDLCEAVVADDELLVCLAVHEVLAQILCSFVLQQVITQVQLLNLGTMWKLVLQFLDVLLV